MIGGMSKSLEFYKNVFKQLSPQDNEMINLGGAYIFGSKL